MKTPEILNEHCGTIGWVGLAAYVIAWDILAPETLSSAVDRALEHPSMKYVAWGIGGVVSGHLFNVIPPALDPIQRVGDYVADRFNL